MAPYTSTLHIMQVYVMSVIYRSGENETVNYP